MFIPNKKLASCEDSAPLTIEGCEAGISHAADYINSRLASKGTLACTGSLDLANKKGEIAGTFSLTGICTPDYL